MDDDFVTRLQAENARLRAENERLEALLRQGASAGELWRESINQRYFDPRTILDEATDFISTADLSGRVGYLNRAGRRLVGIDETADIGQFRIADMHPPWAADLILGEAVPTVLRGGVWRGETALMTHDGREIPVSQIVLAPRTRQGEVKFLFTIIRDITEQKRAQEKLAWEARVNAALAEVSRSLLERITVDGMAYLVLEHAKRLTGSAYGFVGQIDPMTGYLVSSTLSRDIWEVCQVQGKTVVFKEFKGLWGWVLNHRQSLLTNAPADDPRSSGTPPGHIPIQRFISAPAMAEGVLVGQVALANSDRDYGEQDLALIERLADLYAMAIQRKRMEEHLRESQEQFTAFMDHLPAVAFIKNDQCRHVYLNKYFRECFDAADWLGRTVAEKLPPATALGMMASDRRALAGNVLELEQTLTLTVADGRTRVFQTIKFPMRTGAGSPLIGGIAIDISDRKRARDALQESEVKYRRLYESLRDAFVSTDISGHFQEFNAAYQRMLGYSKEELFRLTYQDLTPEKWHAFEAGIIEQQVLPRGYSEIYEKEYRRKDGTVFPIELRTVLIRNSAGEPTSMWAIVRDITERKRVETEQLASLREKEVLLKEIHHRVKNNLQVINSLLDLQVGAVGDPDSREKFRESRDRVRSMALIHERLYRAADLASIDFVEYVKSLVDSLLLSYASANRLITLQTNIEPLSISVEHAVPCGLIINELITNALKYAFPQGGIGIIGVELKMLGEEGRVMLRIWDNGVGLPSSIDPRQSETLGLTIVATLVRQLRGDLTLQRVGGAGFTITFVAPPVKTTQSILERK